MNNWKSLPPPRPLTSFISTACLPAADSTQLSPGPDPTACSPIGPWAPQESLTELLPTRPTALCLCPGCSHCCQMDMLQKQIPWSPCPGEILHRCPRSVLALCMESTFSERESEAGSSPGKHKLPASDPQTQLRQARPPGHGFCNRTGLRQLPDRWPWVALWHLWASFYTPEENNIISLKG